MNDNLLFNQNLLLSDFNAQVHPEVSSYQSVKKIDLSELNKVDSAGVAYLVQIKTQYPALLLVNASTKLKALAKLYGVEYLFDK